MIVIVGKVCDMEVSVGKCGVSLDKRLNAWLAEQAVTRSFIWCFMLLAVVVMDALQDGKVIAS